MSLSRRREFHNPGDYNTPVARVVRDYNQPQQHSGFPPGDGEKSRSPSRGARRSFLRFDLSAIVS